MGSRLHSRTATRSEVISTNGIAFLDEILINATITQTEDDFYAEIVLAVKKDESLKYIYDNLIEEAIITLEDEYGDEFFRISNIRKDKRTITIFARQITIADQLTLFLKDCRPENMNGQATLSKLLNDATGRNKEFFLVSDISNTNTAYYQNMSLYNALFGADNAFIVRWGGEVYRRQYNCKINTRVGQDKGVQIKSRKNLTGFEIKSNVDDLCTRIVPRGFDGIEAPIVESELINNYSSVYTKVMEFSDIKVKSENNPDEGFDTLAQAQQALQERARTQFTLFNIDKLQATYNINFIELSKTEQYKDYSQTESVEIGDTVEVIEDTYGTKIKARCIKRVYSVTMKKRLSTELSNVKKESRPISVNDIIAELEKELQTKPNANLSDYINSMINAGLKDSYVVLKPNELLIMDNKDINKAVNVTRYNKNGLGFSTTGYYGKYEYGFTIDGKINASLITTGLLAGQYIDAKNLTVTNEQGEITMRVTGGGDVYLNVKELKINSKDITTSDSLTSEIDKLKEYLEGAYKDGIIDETEKKILEGQLKDLEKEKESVLGEIDKILNSENLNDTIEKVNLNNAKKEYVNTFYDLINSIRQLIGLEPLEKPTIPDVTLDKNIRIHFPHFQPKVAPAYPDLSLIQNHNGEIYLIDGGEKKSAKLVEDYLIRNNINKIDKVFITHSHSDHIEGIPYLIEKFGCKQLYCKTPNWSLMPTIEIKQWKTKELHELMLQTARDIGAEIIELDSDRKIQLTNKSDILVYNSRNTNYTNYNNISLGFMFRYYYDSYNAIRYFIQGDMSYVSEEFVGGQNVGKIDILKMGHHGNTSSNGETWLGHLRPNISVATIGYPPGNQVKLNTMRCMFVGSKVYLPNDNPNFISFEIDKNNGNISTSGIAHKFINEWYQRDNGDWYYFKYNGEFALNEKLIINNRRYNFNSDGLCTNPEGEEI